MAVKIRLARKGRRKRPTFDVIVADARAPRDGRFIEKIGTYNPLTNPAMVDLKEDRAFHWLMQGAQPSDTVRAMLSYRGILLKKHLQIGINKGKLTQETADEKLAQWKNEQDNKIQNKRDAITKKDKEEKTQRKGAEQKIKEARAEILRKKAEEEAKKIAADIADQENESNESLEIETKKEATNATKEKESSKSAEENVIPTNADVDVKTTPPSTNDRQEEPIKKDNLSKEKGEQPKDI